MKLNKAQKQFLFAHGYVTAKSLDACEEFGWQDYYIREFDWKLNGKDRRGFDQLLFVDKGKSFPTCKGQVCFETGLNFQNSDYDKLLALGKSVKKKA